METTEYGHFGHVQDGSWHQDPPEKKPVKQSPGVDGDRAWNNLWSALGYVDVRPGPTEEQGRVAGPPPPSSLSDEKARSRRRRGRGPIPGGGHLASTAAAWKGTIAVGRRVKVCGLEKNTAFNGLEGIVEGVDGDDPSTCRYDVLLQCAAGKPQRTKIMGKNLMPCSENESVVLGLLDQADINSGPAQLRDEHMVEAYAYVGAADAAAGASSSSVSETQPAPSLDLAGQLKAHGMPLPPTEYMRPET
eukprot:TRINITY_DN19967_c0_g1_i1.p1 TRINITY_DN19967_c0_g1~~TRINITY_DN19967_c0_g1_i1.p1  ORF type:complete len:247 (-),score=48.42 TRINITY_DN19967_c0_g1_i1:255-995(-)